MKKKKKEKTHLIGGIVASVLLVLIFVIFYLVGERLPVYKPVNPSPQTLLENCNVLAYNGEEKLNLVFFSDNETVAEYSNFLFSIPPLDRYRGDFNIFYISDYVPECEIYKDVALLCYNEQNLKKASSCPNDYIIVFNEMGEEIRSSSYMNVLSININHPLLVLPHEFGHAFANFAEEYVPANLPRGSKNCVSSCSQFGGETEGCFEGCSKNSYFRSIDEGIMRTFDSERYGLFDENLIEELILGRVEVSPNKTITGNVVKKIISKPEEKKYYLIGSDGKTTGEAGYAGRTFGPEEYEIRDKNNKIVAKGSINPDVLFTDLPSDEEILSGETYENVGKRMIRIETKTEEGEKITPKSIIVKKRSEVGEETSTETKIIIQKNPKQEQSTEGVKKILLSPSSLTKEQTALTETTSTTDASLTKDATLVKTTDTTSSVSNKI